MKKIKGLIIAVCFLSASVFADSDMKRKDISTIEDVKEFRVLILERMNTKLVSGDLDKRGVKFLKKRITLLETKPLPTQEQIDWHKAQKNKKWKKRKLQHKKIK